MIKYWLKAILYFLTVPIGTPAIMPERREDESTE